jgi:hypothetical protein
VADLQAAGLGTATPSPAARHAARPPEADSVESASSAGSWPTGDSLGGVGESSAAPYPPTLVAAAESTPQTPEETTAPDAWPVPDLADEPADAAETSNAAAAADAAAGDDADDAAGPVDPADSAYTAGPNGHLAEPGAAQQADADKEESDSVGESPRKGESASKEAW